MKKMIAVFQAAMVLCLCFAPITWCAGETETYFDHSTEEHPVESDALCDGVYLETRIDYEGVWLPFHGANFQLYMPEDWVVVSGEGVDGFVLMNAENTRMMWIDLVDGTGFTMDGLLEAMSGSEQTQEAGIVYFNGVPFVRYVNAAEDLFGLATLGADGTMAYLFKFMPLADEGYATLATQMMSSLSPFLPGEEDGEME